MATKTRKPAATDPVRPPDDQPVVMPPPPQVRTARERVDIVLRFCEGDDPFVVDWAPPQS